MKTSWSAALVCLSCFTPALALADEAPPAPEPSAPLARPAADAPPLESVYTRRGPLGPIKLGILGGIGVPDGLQLGLTARGFGRFGVGVTLGSLPTMAVPGVQGASLVRVSGEAYARFYPFKGAFFIGAGVGAMQMKGSIEQTVQAFNQDQHAEAHAYARSVYVSPQIGFLWLTRMGFTFGTDLGAQIPIVTTDVTYDAEKFGLVTPVEGKGSLANAMRFASSMPVPVVNLLRIGYVL